LKNSREFSGLGKPLEPSISSQPVTVRAQCASGTLACAVEPARAVSAVGPPARCPTGRRAGSSSVDSPSSRFQIGPRRPHDLHKVSRAAEFASACRLPIFPDSLCFRQRVPLTNFPAWPGQSSIQPMFVEKSALSIFLDIPCFCQRVPLMNFLAWHGQSTVQPMFVEKSALLILPDIPCFRQRIPLTNFPALPG